VPLYRLHHQSRNDYCYCASIESLEAARKEGYGNPQRLGYVMITQDAQHVPLMRTFNPNTSRYFYTTLVREVDRHAPVISAPELQARLREIFHFDPDTIAKVFTDDLYLCPSREAAEQIIRNSRVAARNYSAEAMDCDDYAQLLKTAFIEDAYDIYDTASSLMPRVSMPYALGVITGIRRGEKRDHYMNMLVTSDGRANDHTFWLIEPQKARMGPASRNRLKDISAMVF